MVNLTVEIVGEGPIIEVVNLFEDGLSMQRHLFQELLYVDL